MSTISPDVAAASTPVTEPGTVADAIAQALVSHGVDRLFLMTGGDLALWRALRDHGIQMCLARSEAASVVMADAYARVTGRTAVVYGQWGPGAANVAGALADAWWARSPVLALTTTVPSTSEYKFEYQEIDQPPMFEPVTKWQARISRPDRAGELVAQALTLASAGSPGPVHVDLPSDMVKQPISSATPAVTRTAAPVTPPAPSAAAVAAIVERIGRSKRPVILSGNGVLLGDGALDLIAFAEAAGIPVATTMGGKGSIPENHELSIGVAGRYSRKVSNDVLRDADLVLAIGTDMGGLASDTYTLPTAEADVLQIDLDAEQIGRTRDVVLGVTADGGAACRALRDAFESVRPSPEHEQWRSAVTARCSAWMQTFKDVAERPADGHVRPEAVAWILREEAGSDDIIVADTGFMGAWGGTLFPVHAVGRTFLRAAGTLGWAFPAVLGAQLAAPESRAFALVGDGGFGYNVGDLETAVRLDIPAITIVLNNACLAYEHVGFMNNYAGDVVDEVCDFLDIDHAAVARAFGAFGARVDSADGLRTALREAIASNRPALIDVVVSKSRFAPVTSFDARLTREL